MKYVYGPVPSRRLGRSLGIDTVPLKTCNWNCVYCQLGRSRPVVNIRREYLPKADILAEVKHTLSLHQPSDIDWVTFVASGETTLHSGIGWLIRQVKEITNIPVAVITNGSFLFQPNVREELLVADAVLPTLDAGSSELYRNLNRPHPDLTFERQVEGLIALRREFIGKLWIEVMIVRDMNDSEQALQDLKVTLARIQPDEVHLLSPTRSPAETWVCPTDHAGLMRATAILSNITTVVPSHNVATELRGSDSVIDAVSNILARHPMSQDQLKNALEQWAPGRVSETLEELHTDPRVRVVHRYGVAFWTGAPSYYPDS